MIDAELLGKGIADDLFKSNALHTPNYYIMESTEDILILKLGGGGIFMDCFLFFPMINCV